MKPLAHCSWDTEDNLHICFLMCALCFRKLNSFNIQRCVSLFVCFAEALELISTAANHSNAAIRKMVSIFLNTIIIYIKLDSSLITKFITNRVCLLCLQSYSLQFFNQPLFYFSPSLSSLYHLVTYWTLYSILEVQQFTKLYFRLHF